ncbi:hypothetical protein NF27_DP01250 [Candidatus Jidaibacter acanthamoeba]|uniref:NADH-quinone oxidoreductase subunit N n=2 Tax=Candidatus Jidaibacter acanthamoebae TaxID=86105 RepID=A0A0C1MZT0_9RICK|nr:hypothetical protein NF27_DP01250 [Candidatus Jidaibacter acanthamoeba]
MRNMYSIWYDLSVIVPELNLIFGALLFLLFGAFTKKNTLKYVCYGAIVLMIASIYHVCANTVKDTMLFNGMLLVNEYTSLIKILLLIAAIVIFFMQASLERTDQYISFEMPVLMMLSTSGMMFLVSSKNFLSLYLSLELMSLPLYIMAAFNRNNEFSAEAGLKYFVLGALSSGLYLFGASLLYGFTGTGGFEAITHYHYNAAAMGINSGNMLPVIMLTGIIFIVVSICFKVSAAPFHMWAPDVYQGSPTIVTAFFAALPKVAMLALFARLLSDPYNLLLGLYKFDQIIIFISIASMFIGSFGAIMQKSIKRMLAYSSIAHVGFALIGIAANQVEGLRGFIVYIIIYLAMTLGIFACILMLRKDDEYKDNISDLSGIAKKYPYLAFAIAVLMFSLAGIPPLAGFFAKFYVLLAAIKEGMYIYSVAAVIASVISAFYYLRIVKIMYFDETKNSVQGFFPITLKVIAALTVVFNLLYFIFPTPIVIIAEEVVKVLLDWHP